MAMIMKLASNNDSATCESLKWQYFFIFKRLVMAIYTHTCRHNITPLIQYVAPHLKKNNAVDPIEQSA